MHQSGSEVSITWAKPGMTASIPASSTSSLQKSCICLRVLCMSPMGLNVSSASMQLASAALSGALQFLFLQLIHPYMARHLVATPCFILATAETSPPQRYSTRVLRHESGYRDDFWFKAAVVVIIAPCFCDCCYHCVFCSHGLSGCCTYLRALNVQTSSCKQGVSGTVVILSNLKNSAITSSLLLVSLLPLPLQRLPRLYRRFPVNPTSNNWKTL